VVIGANESALHLGERAPLHGSHEREAWPVQLAARCAAADRLDFSRSGVPS
jgi:hypothetical protein